MRSMEECGAHLSKRELRDAGAGLVLPWRCKSPQAVGSDFRPDCMIDVNTFIGPYPFRYVPHPDPEVLVRVLERENVQAAWVGHLPSAFYRDPSAGNAQLYTALARHLPVLRPAPVVRPDWPGW